MKEFHCGGSNSPVWLQATSSKQCIQLGLREAPCVGTFCELVWQPSAKENRPLASGPDVGWAIPKHNYLWTSGTCRQCQQASSSLFLCLLLSLNHCPLSQDHSFLLVGIAFLSFPQHTVLSLFCPPPPRFAAVISFSRCRSLSVQKQCILPSPVCLLAPPASAHMFALRPIVSFLLQLVTTSVSLSPALLSPSFLCCLDLSFLLTLVKTLPPPQVATTAEPICYSNPFFFFFPGHCHLLRACVAYSLYK